MSRKTRNITLMQISFHFIRPGCVVRVTSEQRKVLALDYVFSQRILQTCHISHGQLLSPIEAICLLHKNHIIWHNTCIREHCYPFSVLMNSFPAGRLYIKIAQLLHCPDEICGKLASQFINQTPLAGIIAQPAETQSKLDYLI